jgi:hypothetical protein
MLPYVLMQAAQCRLALLPAGCCPVPADQAAQASLPHGLLQQQQQQQQLAQGGNVFGPRWGLPFVRSFHDV